MDGHRSIEWVLEETVLRRRWCRCLLSSSWLGGLFKLELKCVLALGESMARAYPIIAAGKYTKTEEQGEEGDA